MNIDTDYWRRVLRELYFLNDAAIERVLSKIPKNIPSQWERLPKEIQNEINLRGNSAYDL